MMRSRKSLLIIDLLCKVISSFMEADSGDQ